MNDTTCQPSVEREACGNGFRVREVSYAPRTRQPPHAHESTGITLVIAGGIRETVGRREEFGTVLSVVVKPGGVLHADEVGPEGARTIQLLLDTEFDSGFDADLDADLNWRWLHGGPGAPPLLELCRLLRHEPRPGEELVDGVLDVLGRVVGEMGGIGASPRGRRDPPAWLRRAREALDDALPVRVGVRDVAELAGVHPVSLTRAFRRHYGVSVSEYRRRERVRRAALAIEATGDELTRIAYRAGFADHPHMCREVRAATGLTPTELREIVRAAPSPRRLGSV